MRFNYTVVHTNVAFYIDLTSILTPAYVYQCECWISLVLLEAEMDSSLSCGILSFRIISACLYYLITVYGGVVQQHVTYDVTDQWPRRLTACIDAQDDYLINLHRRSGDGW